MEHFVLVLRSNQRTQSSSPHVRKSLWTFGHRDFPPVFPPRLGGGMPLISFLVRARLTCIRATPHSAKSFYSAQFLDAGGGGGVSRVVGTPVGVDCQKTHIQPKDSQKRTA
ncbi:hypothetical protein GWK47_038520 [Chionoecetes opilio]|uniref:Uncharacterized protein n=1 Tax=Chionoecetes opilio TaxID=41210 RepID=A0A8J4YCM4_CHIOP|nr:hypothetical protein GWK47_038520 [Chionoecetes opilio]